MSIYEHDQMNENSQVNFFYKIRIKYLKRYNLQFNSTEYNDSHISYKHNIVFNKQYMKDMDILRRGQYIYIYVCFLKWQMSQPCYERYTLLSSTEMN